MTWPSRYRPEWLLDVLGVAEYDTTKTYALKSNKNHLKLIEPILSPRGERLSKVIVFHRPLQTRVQIPTILLKRADGKVLCRAEIKKVYEDKETAARLTQDALLSFPQEKVEVRLQFSHFKIKALSSEQAARIFSPKSAPFAKENAAAEEGKQPNSPVIQMDLTPVSLEMRYREETMTVSGDLRGKFSLQVLKDQLVAWITANGKQAPSLRISCAASIEYGTVKAILDACRQAGVRKIELRTPRDREDKRSDGATR